jgi:hypothetical protein
LSAVKQRLPAYLVNFVHDELILEFWEDIVTDVRELLIYKKTQSFLDLFKSYRPGSRVVEDEQMQELTDKSLI